jgi:diacylglycerol kinase family enzyme
VSYYRTDDFTVEPRDDVTVNADGEAVAGETFSYDILDRPQLVVGA